MYIHIEHGIYNYLALDQGADICFLMTDNCMLSRTIIRSAAKKLTLKCNWFSSGGFRGNHDSFSDASGVLWILSWIIIDFIAQLIILTTYALLFFNLICKGEMYSNVSSSKLKVIYPVRWRKSRVLAWRPNKPAHNSAYYSSHWQMTEL